jgi:hypothetical protein
MKKKKRLGVLQIVGLSLIAIIAVSTLFVGVSNMTGNTLWAMNYCSRLNKCPAGEGDCDGARATAVTDSDGTIWRESNQCLTGWCHLDVGLNYNKSRLIDVCECRFGTTWNGRDCVD